MKKEKEPKFRTLKLDIDFPYEPYGVQKVMMNHVTRTLMNRDNGLLESPTGTGKTLALLCSTLAWQFHSKEIGQPYISKKLRTQNCDARLDKLRKRACTCGARPNRSDLEQLKEAKENKKGKEGDLYKPDKMTINLPSPSFNEGCESTSKRLKVEPSLQESPYFKKEKANSDDKTEVITLESGDEDDDCQMISKSEIKHEKKQQEHSNNYETDIDTKVVTITETEFELKENGTKIVNQSEKEKCKSCLAIKLEEEFRKLLDDDESEDKTSENIGGKARDTHGRILMKAPRIYYGTRTHKQITQVIRELNKTDYKNKLNMCILSSRERTCINEEVRDLPTRNDRCRELIKNKQNAKETSSKRKEAGDTCPYYTDSNTTNTTFTLINDEYQDKAWDIEDANQFGRNYHACPYYGVRSLQESADITFCPYNYLLDSTIRQTLNINLKDAIIVFDEAHNIEDICRDSASFVITVRDIDEMIDAMKAASSLYIQGSVIMDAVDYFKGKMLNIKFYIENATNSGVIENKEYRRILTQDELATDLKEMGLGKECIQQLKENYKALKGDEEDDSKSSKSTENVQQPLSFNQMQFITQLSLTLEFMYTSDKKNFDDFRGVVAMALDNNRSNPKAKPADRYIKKFSLLCMNPGIAFDKIHSQAWSVIVASGTLSPIESLKSELGCVFNNVYVGAHVVPPDRIFARLLASGPKQVDLNCAFNNSLKLEFQDEVGTVVRDVCKTVPNGILCFFPSYDRMETFYQRWFSKGLIRQIEITGKKIFREKGKISPAEFEKDLEQYHRFAKSKGAVLFAVFRGKVSEGIDFSDMAARAVITIGIPYPNYKDVTVSLKQEYNDSTRSSKPHLMTGRDWYNAQAYRALNQALGRCIRHKQDWGAVIMIDSRLKYGSNNISKWVLRVMGTTQDYAVTRDSLKDFVKVRSLENPTVKIELE